MKIAKDTFDAFIFDVDGTLASTNQLIFDSFNHVAQKYLRTRLTNDEIITLFGPTEEVILKSWMNDDYESAEKDYFEYYSKHHDIAAKIYDGLKEVMEIIKSQGKPIAIFTGKGRKSTEITLDKIGLLKFFDFIITGTDVTNHKPSPEGLNMILERFNVSKEKTLFIGDAPVDYIAAKEAKVKFGAALWDSYLEEELREMPCDFYFYSINDLKKLVEKN
ncbi:MAG: HAD-IA family hydrolase [bacterium]